MKTIGIIGGLGPHSTVKYYEWLNDGVQKALGGAHSAKVLLTSLDGEEIKNFRMAGDDEGECALFAREAKNLERSGADFIIIASNTSHKNAPAVAQAVSVPFLHLADMTAQRILKAGRKKILLLGTKYTMEQDFYKQRLIDAGLDVFVPDDEDRAFISGTIYNELVKNIVKPDVPEKFSSIIRKHQDADGVILGCTELTLLGLDGDDLGVELFDTTKIHVDAALEFMLAA